MGRMAVSRQFDVAGSGVTNARRAPSNTFGVAAQCRSSALPGVSGCSRRMVRESSTDGVCSVTAARVGGSGIASGREGSRTPPLSYVQW
jgi:hypothetical protein